MTTVLYDIECRKACDVYTASEHTGLPWDAKLDDLQKAFTAGFAAGLSSLASAAPAHAMALATYAALEADFCKPTPPMPLPGSAAKAIMDGTDWPPATTPEDIYKAYPRHVGRQSAIKAINKAALALRKADPGLFALGHLLDATKAYKAATDSWPAADKKFIPHPASWFNAGCYEDDRKEWNRGFKATGSAFSKPAH